ncbi:MAG: GNAT family N-acetyltransferase [Bdellovibrionales bacterium]|nr:GNAT family N-acetyltransferase [Bdellovibrionales bacterium]
MAEIRRVLSSKDWAAFVALGHPSELRTREAVAWLDVNGNPFFRHSYLAAFMAWDSGKPVARVAVVIDELRNHLRSERGAFLCLLHAPSSSEVSPLLEEASRWASGRGAEVLWGPTTQGLRPDGGLPLNEQSRPLQSAFKGAGFSRALDLHAFAIDAESRASERLLMHAERLTRGRGVSVRSINPSRWESEAALILNLYQESFQGDWRMGPWEPAEALYLGRRFKRTWDPKLILVLEQWGKPAGFALGLPDLDSPRGDRGFRIAALGVRPGLRHQGLGAALYAEYLRRAPELGYQRAEAAWVPEGNGPMLKALRRLGAKPSRVSRVYERPLNG